MGGGSEPKGMGVEGSGSLISVFIVAVKALVEGWLWKG